ncbi:MFS transporter [Streptomyces sp. RFCAC02]|uniref:MFS transporter n=1 Tax=Streptomyces sp. RFCAC02 TaxID=2499143 RepID=UPI00101FA048|nr:MFS transporter [Streptomyces sp. RFCAC02]
MSQPSAAPDRERVRRARRAVGTVFALHGAVAGSFATRIPWIQEQLDLSAAQLGLALAFPAFGAALAMPLASRMMHRFGARAALRWLLAMWTAAVALPALAPSLPVLCAALMVYGAASGVSDVAMNAQGVEVERHHGRSIMSGLHGLWSVGTLLSSALGVAVVHIGVDARVHLPLVALALTLVGPVVCRHLIDVRAEPEEEPPPRFALPPRSALLIGVVGMSAVLAEGASMDWSGVYLRDMAGASETIAAASFTAFACMMGAARLTGDMVVRRIGPVRTARTGSVVALTGGLLVVTARTPVQGIAGFALLGIGIATVVPLAFAAAGRSGSNPGQAIAGVATVTYTMNLLAPTVIGLIGDMATLRVSFVVVTAGTAVFGLAAGVLGPRRERTGPVAASPVPVAGVGDSAV